jgi:hypothetical protein
VIVSERGRLVERNAGPMPMQKRQPRGRAQLRRSERLTPWASIPSAEAFEPLAVRTRIESLGGDPSLVVVAREVALAGIANERDNRAGNARGDHFLRELEGPDQVGSGRAAALSPDDPFKPVDRGNRGSVRCAQHPVNDAGNERGLYSRASDAFDPRSLFDQRASLTGAVKVEKRRVFRVDDAEAAHHGSALAVANVAADGRRRAAGSGADDYPGRGREPLESHLGEEALGDVVVPAPVRRALGVGELVHVVTV